MIRLLQRHEEALHDSYDCRSCAHGSCTRTAHNPCVENRHRWNPRSNVGEYSQPNRRHWIGGWDLARKYVGRSCRIGVGVRHGFSSWGSTVSRRCSIRVRAKPIQSARSESMAEPGEAFLRGK
jgi:hypothetical protein